MGHEGGFRVRRNDNHRNSEAQSGTVQYWWRNVVIETAPIIPGQENSGIAIDGTIHDRFDLVRHEILSRLHLVRGMIGRERRWGNPGNSGEFPALDVRNELARMVNIVGRSR